MLTCEIHYQLIDYRIVLCDEGNFSRTKTDKNLKNIRTLLIKEQNTQVRKEENKSIINM